MAESPAHKFGQVIGDMLEAAVEPLLGDFARRRGLYLDKKDPRRARKGLKVAWTDLFGNSHDLDFVLERGGSATKLGTPVAFIETAWRRYTKHSRNKAQEVQGAILPLATTHQTAAPFIGVVLAGVFTEGSLTQLRSLGFTVLYFPYESVVASFRRIGIDARFDERTADAAFARKVQAWEALPPKDRARVAKSLLKANTDQVQNFMRCLERCVTRTVASVRVLPLHGSPHEWKTVAEALAFIQAYHDGETSAPVARYEVQVRYSNGDRVEGQFTDKQGALQFLRNYQGT